MLQRFVDNVLAVAKESVKTFTYESLNNIVRLINGVSALLLTILPGKAKILEGIHGWELRPTFRGPRFPRWMENGVSSFNQFIYELSVDSDTSSVDYSSAEEDSDRNIYPASPSSQSSRVSGAGTFTKVSKAPALSRSHQHSGLHSIKRVFTLRDQIVHRTTDRRRGVIEDLHLAIEIFIEAIFDVVHKAAHFILSPSEAFRKLFRGVSYYIGRTKENHVNVVEVSVTTDTLGENDPAPTEQNMTFYQSLNTDARTCQDVITELGYPYEAIHVVTADGYVLLLERIPRRDARKAVYLQHGVFDSSMGWVSNGVVGSPAFAAFDQGYDVFLGNFRGLVSREHADKNISSRRYWQYSINEHGTEDIPAMIEKIHEVKTSELKLSQPSLQEESDDQPYKLCAICHSLGGAAILIFFRMLLNKLARDFHNYPAVGGLVQTLMSYVVGGDSSNWIGVLGLPHYNMNDMPGVSFHLALHLAQMKHTGKFRMYDYGSASANMEVYGSPEPLDLGEYYGLIDIPVDLVAGQKDKVIRPSMVRKHYKVMKNSGVDVSYNEFEYAHLDFTFSHREELLTYVMSRLLLVEPTPKQPSSQKALRLKKKGL
nr:lipase member n [Quercus suber]